MASQHRPAPPERSNTGGSSIGRLSYISKSTIQKGVSKLSVVEEHGAVPPDGTLVGRPSYASKSTFQKSVSALSALVGRPSYASRGTAQTEESHFSYASKGTAQTEKSHFSKSPPKRSSVASWWSSVTSATLLQPRESISHASKFGTFYEETRPVKGQRYFARNDASCTATVICLYNEDGGDLSRTLDSLVAGPPLDVVIVSDGLEALSLSMEEYLLKLFPLDSAVFDGSKWGISHTFVSAPIQLGPSSRSRVYLLLKRFNHKKVNSHEWFFMAHAPNTCCRYAFTTDCGSLFRDGTVQKLISHLDSHTSCVAVTGRQRCMSAINQHGSLVIQDSWSEWVFRCVQAFGFELDHVMGKAADCAGGLLLCLHGPCAMFRLADIQGRCLNEYFDLWGYAAAHQLGILGANLQIGEDRVLSLLSALDSGKHLASLFEATFEFDPELVLKSFMTQRRRWHNSGMAAAVYIASQSYQVLSSSHSLVFRMWNLVLLLIWLLQIVGTFLLPGIFGALFAFAAGDVGKRINSSYEGPALVAETALYTMLYILVVSVHLKRAKDDCAVQPTLIKWVAAHGALMFLSTIGVAMSLAVELGQRYVLIAITVPVLIPFVTAAVSGSCEGLLFMCRSAIVYYLVAPTFVGLGTAYYTARLADISWGNRPSASSHSMKALRKSGHLNDAEEDAKLWLALQIRRCAVLNAFLVFANFALIVLLPFLAQHLARNSAVDDRIALFLIITAFALPSCVQQIVGVCFHVVRQASRCCHSSTLPTPESDQSIQNESTQNETWKDDASAVLSERAMLSEDRGVPHGLVSL